jgi:hypothetical protein
VDLDQKETYSSVIQLNNTQEGLATVFPNPAHDFIKVNTLSKVVDQIKISDLEGNIIYDNKNIMNNEASILISTSGMNTGCYLVQVISSDTEMRSKVMIIK